MKTLQEIFDIAAKHMLAQGERAWVSGEGCRYRTEGLKCAVGCLIPDDRYRPEMEGQMLEDAFSELVEALVDLGCLPDTRGMSEHFRLLCQLQIAHDVMNPIQWSARLAGIAEEFGLRKDVLNEDAARDLR